MAKRTVKKTLLNALYIQYCYSSKQRALLPTGIYIPSVAWNSQKATILGSLPDECVTASELNKCPSKMLRIVNHLIDQAEEHDANPLEYVREMFRPDLTIAELANNQVYFEKKQQEREQQAAAQKTLYNQIDQYIDSKTKKVSPDVIRIYKNMKCHLQAFEDFREEELRSNRSILRFMKSLLIF